MATSGLVNEVLTMADWVAPRKWRSSSPSDASVTLVEGLVAVQDCHLAVTVKLWLPAESPVSVQLVTAVGDEDVGQLPAGLPPSRDTKYVTVPVPGGVMPGAQLERNRPSPWRRRTYGRRLKSPRGRQARTRSVRREVRPCRLHPIATSTAKNSPIRERRLMASPPCSW